jgi:hypothetical protein
MVSSSAISRGISTLTDRDSKRIKGLLFAIYSVYNYYRNHYNPALIDLNPEVKVNLR